jgi:hypothetical protein
MIELSIQNSAGEFPALQEPHPYGPSLRYLWTEAKQSGKSDEAASEHIIAWARHRPAVWELEDKRKKKSKAHSVLLLAEHLTRKLNWSRSDDLDFPWRTEVEGIRWQIRLNDFPDDMMYSLLVNDEAIVNFHDWPETWQRE